MYISPVSLRFLARKVVIIRIRIVMIIMIIIVKYLISANL